jgi:hypothetical protein
MDEKLKQQVLISLLPAGLIFMIYQFAFNMSGAISGFMIAFVLAAVAFGITFGIVYMVQKNQ